MSNDFLDGIDDAFQRLMKTNGNGKLNGNSKARLQEDRVTAEIVEHLQDLSKPQLEEVLTLVRSLAKSKEE